MEKINKKYKIRGRIPPLIFIGAIAVLFPIFAYMTIENINRQKVQNIKMLLEKSAALIRSFEAGTRTGMMGMHWKRRNLQNLLTETAIQPDIEYLMVTDKQGIILAHNNPEMIGKEHGRELDLSNISQSKELGWRFLKKKTDGKLFEVFRKFSPTVRHFGKHQANRMRSMFHKMDNFFNESPIIFVGLDISSIEEAEKSDMYHTIIMTTILLFIGFTGMIIVFLIQRYQAAKL